MRALWATSHMPDPDRGGGAAFEYELLRHAAGRHEVVLLSAARDGPVPGAVARLGIEVHRVAWAPMRRPRNRPEMLWRALTVRMGIVGGITGPCARALSDGVVGLEREQRFDLVHVWPGEMAEVASVCRAPSAVFLTDIHTRQRRRERAQADSLRQRLITAVELRKVRAWEQRAYPKAAVLATVTELDAAALHELTGRQACVVPLMIGDEWFEEPTCARGDDLVTLVGALDYKPNVDAVGWLADDIWPRVRATNPGARLRIVGRNPVDEVRRAAAQAGAELLADVPDVRPHYWSAAVVVAPIRLGSGMRNKILHAAACGAPQVATTTAIEGIGLRPGEDLLVADDSKTFARAVGQALDEPDPARLRAAGAVEAVRRYRPGEVAAAFDRFWESAAAGMRRA